MCIWELNSHQCPYAANLLTCTHLCSTTCIQMQDQHQEEPKKKLTIQSGDDDRQKSTHLPITHHNKYFTLLAKNKKPSTPFLTLGIYSFARWH